MTGRVHIGVGTLDGKIHQECVMGLLDTYGRISCSVSFVRGPYIGRNRDIVTADALSRTDVSHVLYVDSDIRWSFEDLRKLLELNLPFTFGLYPFKTGAGQPVADDRMGSIGPAVEFGSCGAGFVLVKREALEHMIAAHPELSYVDPTGRHLHGLWWGTGRREDGTMVGEDNLFCERWRKCGGRIFTREDVRLGHVGSHVFELRSDSVKP